MIRSVMRVIVLHIHIDLLMQRTYGGGCDKQTELFYVALLEFREGLSGKRSALMENRTPLFTLYFSAVWVGVKLVGRWQRTSLWVPFPGVDALTVCWPQAKPFSYIFLFNPCKHNDIDTSVILTCIPEGNEA